LRSRGAADFPVDWLVCLALVMGTMGLGVPAWAEGSSSELDAAPSRADDARGEKPAPPDAPAESVELDRLLQLPSSMTFDDEKRSGASPEAWRERFRRSYREIQAARDRVEATRRALDEAAGTSGGSQWQMGPPGSNNTEVTPVSFKLREELREGREQLEDAERRHRELVIQADLAGVPEAWRQPD
jgi:hypothetical protein